MEKDLRKAEKRVSTLEEDIERLETKIAQWDEDLLQPEKFQELGKDPGFFTTYEAEKKKLEKLMKEWENAQKELDAIQANAE